jgi:hypothetical protein
MFSRAFSLLIAVATVACHRSPSGGDAGPAASATPSPAAVALEGSSPEGAWVEARSGDPLELARLANLEGVDKLAEVAGNEHASLEDRASAIRAISFTPDPTPALETLTKLVLDPTVERSTLALQTLAHVAPKRAPVEELEPGAWRTCADGLLVALKTIQGAARRDLAILTLRALADRGAVTGASIPAR